MPKFNTRKNVKYLSNVHKIVGAHLQCESNHYELFKYKGMKTVGVTDYTNLTPPTHFVWKKPTFNTRKNVKYLSNVHKIGGAHLKYLSSHYAKFE